MKVHTNKNNLITGLFESQVELTPESIACIYNGIRFSYQELNIKANQLAQYISKKYSFNSNDLLVLCLDRNENILIAILAAIKIGLAYLPIDPDYPPERINYILQETKSNIILTNNQHIPMLETILHRPNEFTSYIIPIDNPKGVMIERSGVVNLVKNQARIFNLERLDANTINLSKNCLWFANYVFDAHAWDIFAPLCNGHTVHLVDSNTHQYLHLLAEYIAKHNIYLATIPPALLDTSTLLKLQYLIVAGQISSLALMFSALLISFHIYFGRFNLLITSCIMLITLVALNVKKAPAL